MRPEGLCPTITTGIESSTFRLVAHVLKQVHNRITFVLSKPPASLKSVNGLYCPIVCSFCLKFITKINPTVYAILSQRVYGIPFLPIYTRVCTLFSNLSLHQVLSECP
jgi:hypothetical protein